MNWRSRGTGAVISLVVTILAGLIVYYATKETTPTEQLVYRISALAKFTTEGSDKTFITIYTENRGSKTAKNVRIVAEFKDGFSIREKDISSSAAPVAEFKDLSTANRLEIAIPFFVSGEQFTTTLLIEGPGLPNPRLGVRSDESIGTRAEPKTPKKTEQALIATLAALLVGGLSGIAMAVFARVSRRRGFFDAAKTRKNNTAFVLMHQGLTEDASQLFHNTFLQHGADPLLLANYGLSLGLLGDT
jgi:hypothetical protein